MSRERLLSDSALSSKKTKYHESLASDSALSKKARKLEISAISAEGLVDGGKPVKKKAFVAFEIAGNHHWMRTSVDEVGGDYPKWEEEKLETEFWSSSSEKKEESFMYVRVYCQISNKDKHVATARVPVKDFTGEYAPEGFLQCLSYRLWDDYGKRNGIVNFSARIVPEANKGGLRPFWLR